MRTTGSDEDERVPGPGSRAARIFNLVVFVAGGFALWWMLRNQSWQELRGHLEGVGSWFALILALEVTALLCDAADDEHDQGEDPREGAPTLLGGGGVLVVGGLGHVGSP